MKAVIIGRNGQVAWELQQSVPANIETLVLGSSDIDILDFDALSLKISQFEPDVIINASAYTAVDKAESEHEQAFAINELAVGNLARIAKSEQARFIHISTDFVFDGSKNTAYSVEDDTNPVSVYGQSKLAGERNLLDVYPDNSVTIRTSWVYSSHGNNFVKTMLRLMAEKEQLSVVSDQIGCPTYAADLAKFIWIISLEKHVQHLYNWTDLGVASWYDFAQTIQEVGLEKGIISKKIPIEPISSAQYPTPAKRPHFSLLDVAGSQTILKGKYWKNNLELCITKMLAP